jgi:phospholipid/cholesterol/gamma-HCH transport system substrate-binding protein
MSNAQMSARVGLFFVFGIALIWVVFESLSAGKLSRDHGYTLVAHFRNLKELKVGDEVRMAGVKIGAVQSTELQGRQAVATLLIDDKIQIAKDSTATIGMAGLLGSNYVALDLGSDNVGFLAPGDAVKSVDTPDLNTIVRELGDIGTKVDTALSGFSQSLNGGAQGPGLLGKIDKLVDENSGKIGQITTNLQEITDKINKGQGTLGKLVNDDQLHRDLLATMGEIKGAATEAKDFVANAQSVIDQVKSGKGTIGVLLYDQESADNLKVTMRNVREISDKLNQGKGTLGKLFNDDSLYLQAQGAVKKLDRALDGMSDEAPVSAVASAAQALF